MGCYEILAAAQNGEVIDVLTLVACPERCGWGRMLLLHPDGRQDGVLWRQDFTEKAVAYIREQSWPGAESDASELIPAAAVRFSGTVCCRLARRLFLEPVISVGLWRRC